MKSIITKPWNYSFFEKENKLFLSVVCGGVAVFEINLELNKEEVGKYELEGVLYIDKLAKEIQHSPSKFTERNITNNRS